MSYLIKNAHFLIIHIPIAMLLFSFVFDVLAKILKKKEWNTAGLLCLVVGTLGAVAAVITGPESERNPLFPTHELFGKLTMILALLLCAVRLILVWKKKIDIGSSIIYLIVMLLGVGLVTYTGHLGGQMVHPDRSQFQRGGFPGEFQGGQRGQWQNQRRGQFQQGNDQEANPNWQNSNGDDQGGNPNWRNRNQEENNNQN